MYDDNSNKSCAIILAAGLGTRMGSDITKQRMMIGNRTVLYRTVRAFQLCIDVDTIVVVARAEEVDDIRADLAGLDKVVRIVAGGSCRAESAIRGFATIPDDTALIIIHDGARCLITTEQIEKVITEQLPMKPRSKLKELSHIFLR